MTYKVFFHTGENFTLKTIVSKGEAWVDDQGLHVSSAPGTLTVPSNAISSVDLFRLHGTMRVIRVDHAQGRLFLSVVRLMIGQFAFVNFLKTGELKDRVKPALFSNLTIAFDHGRIPVSAGALIQAKA